MQTTNTIARRFPELLPDTQFMAPGQGDIRLDLDEVAGPAQTVLGAVRGGLLAGLDVVLEMSSTRPGLFAIEVLRAGQWQVWTVIASTHIAAADQKGFRFNPGLDPYRVSFTAECTGAARATVYSQTRAPLL